MTVMPPLTHLSYPDTLIIIFAREPVQGKVKTRLIPALGTEGATELYKRLLDYALNNVIGADLSPVNLCITPESHGSYFTRVYGGSQFELSFQDGHDLGDRMYRALAEALTRYSKAILIGTDCPFLTKQDLELAIKALDEYDMVFTPAVDGGYVLVAAKNLSIEAFVDIDWGTEKVMKQSRNALSRQGISWHELPEKNDIDVKEDLRSLSLHNEFKDLFQTQ